MRLFENPDHNLIPYAPLELDAYDPPTRNWGGLFAIFALFAIAGYFLMTIDPNPATSPAQPNSPAQPRTAPPAQSFPAPPPTAVPVTTPVISDYVLNQDNRLNLSAEATRIALALAEVDGRLQAATNTEREQLQNDRTRLQNAAAALDVTRGALDAHNQAAATAAAISANATTNSQQSQHIAAATAAHMQSQANAEAIQHQRAQALVTAEQATANRLASEAETAAAVNKIITTAAAITAAVVVAAVATIIGITAWAHGRTLLANTPAPAPRPAPPQLPPPPPTRHPADELFNRHQSAPTHPPIRDRRTAAPSQPPTSGHSTVTDASQTAVTDVEEPFIDPTQPLSEEDRRRIVAIYHTHGGLVTPTARQAFGASNGRRNAIVRAVIDQLTHAEATQ